MARIKRAMAFLLACVLVIAMGVCVSAEDTTYTITINNSASGHTYEAYQIFSGDLSADGTTLSNITWGSSVTDAAKTAIGDAAEKAESLASEADAKAFAKTLVDTTDYLGDPVGTLAEGNGTYTLAGLKPGYYLVKDQDGSIEDATTDAYTSYILKVVKDVTANAKSDTVKVEKKVQDTNDSTGETTGWQDSADYDIGDQVPFQLKATLPGNVSAYDTYKVVFHDTMSTGLTYDGNAAVYVDGVNRTSNFIIASETNSNGGTNLTITCNDVKAAAVGAGNDSVITVEYTATLNRNAVHGAAGNPNKVSLEYSNNPNHSGEGDNDTGNTPEDTVIVFTYKTIINKVVESGSTESGESVYAPLAGAAFKLEKLVMGKDADGNNTEASYQTVKEFEVDSKNPATSFEFTGLDDGQYKLTETVTPSGYNTIAPVEFMIVATHTNDGDENPLTLTDLKGNKVEGSIDLGFVAAQDKSSLTASVENKKGSTLPETGGMGTKLFYIFGSIMVLAAGILLVAKKRMNA